MKKGKLKNLSEWKNLSKNETRYSKVKMEKK